MKFKTTEKVLFDILERDGVVNNLGKTYMSIANSTKEICNIYIIEFINRIKIIYPTAKLEIGREDDLYDAKIIIR
ncbi:MAG: hypothetical protein E7E64_05050 [Clostridium celatum]|uniref:hypothetical protein n=1 Tax=Clostridium tertium TaxID=1559 RepID=UPI0029023F11|nr:hypothetical protein [Clostridium celatum]